MGEENISLAHAKAIRLFTYLEKALAIDDTVIRDFRATTLDSSTWWLSEYPTDQDNLKIKFSTNEELSEENDTPILKVQKKSIEKNPPLPDTLLEWVDSVAPDKPPTAKESIDKIVLFEDSEDRKQSFNDFSRDHYADKPIPESLDGWITMKLDETPKIIEQRHFPEYFTSHPELEELLKNYIEFEWKPWAEKTISAFRVNTLYDQLYALRLSIKNDSDRFELAYGHGVLTWIAKGQLIYSPLFITPLVLDFNAITRTIVISQDSMLRSYVDLSSLQELDLPSEMDLVSWSDKINSDPFDFWHLESIKAQSRFLINTLSNNSEDNFKEVTSNPSVSDSPTVWNSPVIFVRQRNNDLWSKYSGLIRRDIERNNAKPSDFITDLVGEYGVAEVATEIPDAQEFDDGGTIADGELYFPLPWNEEQRKIADRIESSYGVVVKGPPGTGKSHTIANLISRFLAQGKTVLVTSQASKALEVLRDMLPENIRSLAVSQLQQSAKQDQVMQESVAEISSNLGERHTKFSDEKLDAVARNLKSIREQKATLANKIRKYILADSQLTIDIDGTSYTPMSAAKMISSVTNDKMRWFTDTINKDASLSFNFEDIRKLYDLLGGLTDHELSLSSFDLPDLNQLPSYETVKSAFESRAALYANYRMSKSVLKNDPLLDQGSTLKMITRLESAISHLDSIHLPSELELFERCSVSDSEKQKWFEILKRVFLDLQNIKKNENLLLGHEVIGETDLLDDRKVHAINLLTEKLTDNSKITGVKKLLLPSDAKEILSSYKIDGHSPESNTDLQLVLAKVSIEVSQKDVKALFTQNFKLLSSPPQIEGLEKDTLKLELFLRELTRIVKYSDNFSDVFDFLKDNGDLEIYNPNKKNDLVNVLHLLNSYSAKFQIITIDKLISDWVNLVTPSGLEMPHDIFKKLVDALNDRDSTNWSELLRQLNNLTSKKKLSEEFDLVSRTIKGAAPKLFEQIENRANDRSNIDYMQSIDEVWRLARLASWLNEIRDGMDIDDMQKSHERLNRQELELNSELVTLTAWQRQIDRVTKTQRDALMAWSHSMQQYGKGKGKYAHRHLRAAQESLMQAKNAVPVWIMPLNRVAQMFSDPKAGMFDVVIFDEASQCDIKGINIGYLGKKMLVVGDPEQISPAGGFQNQEKIFELISRFLFDIPYKESFLVTSSLFALAKIRLSNIVQLNEHFRCVPEIIAFSNNHVYEGKLKPLRYPQPEGRLLPALVPIFVENGYQNKNNKCNEPEAQAIVNKLEELLADPRYQKRPNGELCSFGVISLLAEDQVKLISDLIRDRFDEKTIEERRIVCGDAYAFQGDERDVILLSMVKAHDPDKIDERIMPLTKRDAMQRFNVAASRAKDQMFLFHSLPISSLHNEEDWRLKLLNSFYNPKVEELDAGRQALKKEFDAGHASQFSVDVGNLLIDKGYKVIPEFPVIGYRIDLVVQGETSRLAIECDGDQYHTLENWENDQIRERQLRRAGWVFWRLTGSSFYLHGEKALESLWTKLEELGIEPITKAKTETTLIND